MEKKKNIMDIAHKPISDINNDNRIESIQAKQKQALDIYKKKIDDIFNKRDENTSNNIRKSDIEEITNKQLDDDIEITGLGGTYDENEFKIDKELVKTLSSLDLKYTKYCLDKIILEYLEKGDVITIIFLLNNDDIYQLNIEIKAIAGMQINCSTELINFNNDKKSYDKSNLVLPILKNGSRKLNIEYSDIENGKHTFKEDNITDLYLYKRNLTLGISMKLKLITASFKK